MPFNSRDRIWHPDICQASLFRVGSAISELCCVSCCCVFIVTQAVTYTLILKRTSINGAHGPNFANEFWPQPCRHWRHDLWIWVWLKDLKLLPSGGDIQAPLNFILICFSSQILAYRITLILPLRSYETRSVQFRLCRYMYTCRKRTCTINTYPN